MSLLTDRADDTVAALAPWAVCGALAFIGYALSCHFGWRDGIAMLFAFWFVQRRVSLNGGKE